MTNGTYTLYSSTTCTRCPLAKRSMDRAGAEYVEVKLDLPDSESAQALIDLKEKLGVSPTSPLSVPIVETPDGRHLTNLATISEEFREAA